MYEHESVYGEHSQNERVHEYSENDHATGAQ